VDELVDGVLQGVPGQGDVVTVERGDNKHDARPQAPLVTRICV
jgi:hypothetical protein